MHGDRMPNAVDSRPFTEGFALLSTTAIISQASPVCWAYIQRIFISVQYGVLLSMNGTYHSFKGGKWLSTPSMHTLCKTAYAFTSAAHCTLHNTPQTQPATHERCWSTTPALLATSALRTSCPRWLRFDQRWTSTLHRPSGYRRALPPSSARKDRTQVPAIQVRWVKVGLTSTNMGQLLLLPQVPT